MVIPLGWICRSTTMRPSHHTVCKHCVAWPAGPPGSKTIMEGWGFERPPWPTYITNNGNHLTKGGTIWRVLKMFINFMLDKYEPPKGQWNLDECHILASANWTEGNDCEGFQLITGWDRWTTQSNWTCSRAARHPSEPKTCTVKSHKLKTIHLINS